MAVRSKVVPRVHTLNTHSPQTITHCKLSHITIIYTQLPHLTSLVDTLHLREGDCMEACPIRARLQVLQLMDGRGM